MFFHSTGYICSLKTKRISTDIYVTLYINKSFSFARESVINLHKYNVILIVTCNKTRSSKIKPDITITREENLFLSNIPTHICINWLELNIKIGVKHYAMLNPWRTANLPYLSNMRKVQRHRGNSDEQLTSVTLLIE